MPPKIDRLTISLVMITVLLLLAIFVGPLLWIYVNSVFFGKQEILNVAKSITTNKNDPTSLLEAIADWEKENMVYNTRSVYFYPILPLLMWRISHPNPAWVMSIKRGDVKNLSAKLPKQSKKPKNL